MKMTRKPFQEILLYLLLAAVCGCSLYKETEQTVKETEKTVKEAEKAVKGVEKATQQKGGGKETETSATHEGPLLDNQVSAMRVQDALKRAGTAFDQVQVKATNEAVIMTGTVKSSKDRERAEEIAKGTKRQMKLKNELQVR